MHSALEVGEGEAEERGGLGEGDAGEVDQVQGGQGAGAALVVAGQAAQCGTGSVLGTPVATTGRVTKKETDHDDSADGQRPHRG